MGLREAQGQDKKLQVGLGRVFKHITLNNLKGCSEGELVVGLGPEVVGATGGGDLIGPESSVPFSRALDEFLLSKAREESGDKDPLIGLTRAALLSEALKVVERVLLTNEALFIEASRYIETLSFSVGGRELYFSTRSSGFNRVVTKKGSFNKLASVDGEEEHNPLSIILAYGRSRKMASKGEKTLAEEGVGSEDEELL